MSNEFLLHSVIHSHSIDSKLFELCKTLSGTKISSTCQVSEKTCNIGRITLRTITYTVFVVDAWFCLQSPKQQLRRPRENGCMQFVTRLMTDSDDDDDDDKPGMYGFHSLSNPPPPLARAQRMVRLYVGLQCRIYSLSSLPPLQSKDNKFLVVNEGRGTDDR